MTLIVVPVITVIGFTVALMCLMLGMFLLVISQMRMVQIIREQDAILMNVYQSLKDALTEIENAKRS